MRKIRIEWLAAALVVVVAVVLIILLVSTLHPSAHEADIRLPDSTQIADVSQPEVRPSEPTDDARPVTLTTKNVQNVIATLRRPESYHLLAETVVSYGDESRVTQTEEWVSPDRCVTRTQDSLTGSTLCAVTEAGRSLLWYEGEDRLLDLGGEAFTDPDQMAGMPSWSDVLALDPGSITAAEYRGMEEIPCIFVESYDGTLDYSNRYYISQETGLLIYAETFAKGELVCSMRLILCDGEMDGEEDVIPPQ